MNLFQEPSSAIVRVTDQTLVEPAALIATFLLGVILLLLPRRYAVVP